MDWFGTNQSIHHRDEYTNSDFSNANGGILGDSKIVLRYLHKNTGAGDGYRIIFGGGIVIPSKNTITINPFKKTDGEYSPHRHFSISNGTYNYISDLQIFYKRSSNPVFFGGSFTFEKPFEQNEYSYLQPIVINALFSTIIFSFIYSVPKHIFNTSSIFFVPYNLKLTDKSLFICCNLFIISLKFIIFFFTDNNELIVFV